ncbi:hypothetical protein Tco_1535824 [Tanacetum coccineum]
MSRFLRWVETEKVSSEVESKKLSGPLLHSTSVAFYVSTDGREEDSFLEMECSGSIVSEKIGDSSRMATSVSILEKPIKVANALSRTVSN